MLAQVQPDIILAINDEKKISNMKSIGKHVASVFAVDAQILYVPTGLKASGHSQIERMLSHYQAQAHTIENENVLTQSVTKNQIVLESTMSISHSEEISWCLPGVKPTRKLVDIALVTIITLNNDGKIQAKRVYWDQASVLRQINVLPKSLYCRSNNSEVTLPILGAEILSAINTMTFNKFDELLEEVIEEHSDEVILDNIEKISDLRVDSAEGIFSDTADFRPSSRVLSQPGGQSSDIFSNEPFVKLHESKRHIQQPATSLFDDTPIAAFSSKGRRDPNRSSVDDLPSVVPKLSRPYSGQTNQSHFSLGGEGFDAEEFHSAKRVDPTNNKSQFTFADDSGTASAFLKRRDPNARSQEITQRPSSRVLSAPGGYSNFSLSHDPVVDGKNGISRRDPNARSQENDQRPTSRFI